LSGYPLQTRLNITTSVGSASSNIDASAGF
jgi:hypothetical protein